MKTRIVIVLLAAALAACSNSAPSEQLTDAGPPSDSGSRVDGGAGPDCFMNPKTHLEIINACTDAAAVDKKVTLPLANPDGTLPPLPQ